MEVLNLVTRADSLGSKKLALSKISKKAKNKQTSSHGINYYLLIIFVMKFLNVQKSTEYNKQPCLTNANILSYLPWIFLKRRKTF